MLVGRDSELAEVRRMLDRAGAHAGGVLVFTGPPGVGKTAMLDASADLASGCGFEVLRSCPSAAAPGRVIWAQLLRDVGAPDDFAARLLADPDHLDLDTAARALVSERPRLIVVDDIHRGGDDCVRLLAVLAPRLAGAPTVVLASAPSPLGVGGEAHLKPLREEDLQALVGELPAETRRGLWIASRGLPGAARVLAAELQALPPGEEAVVYLALHAVAQGAFLEVDVSLVRLLESALARATDAQTRARLLARLSASLLADASAHERRRALADEALELARRSGDPRTLAEILDARLHALWDPQSAEDRLAAGSEIIDLARAAGDDERERHGLFWRFIALMELGRVSEAESCLAAFDREADVTGDPEARIKAMARHAMLDTLRGRFDQAARVGEAVAEEATRIGHPDATFVASALRITIAVERDRQVMTEIVERLLPTFIRRRPGHFFEAHAARAFATLGRISDATIELERVLPRALSGSGPRWLGAMSELATAAWIIGDRPAAARIYEAMLPYRGRLVVFSGGIMVWGPVEHYLGLLATTSGTFDEAVDHFGEAIAVEERIGALPYLAHSLAGLAAALDARGGERDREASRASLYRARSIAERLGMTSLLERLAPPADEWQLYREGEDWVLHAGGERARLRDARGLHYLRVLVSSPARDVPTLDLVAGGGGLVPSDAGPLLDDAALSAYRRRLAILDEDVEAADAAGNAAWAERLEKERQAVLDELRRATGLGGRSRRTSPEAERARVNVTRTLRATIERIEEVAPRAGAHLRASVRTGIACRYDPAPGGPARWRV